MIILDVSIKNLHSFKDFYIDFIVEPKKNKKNSFIEPTHLQGAPKIFYKKVNVLMGANASGKTLFGRILMAFQNLIVGRDGSFLTVPFDKDIPSEFKVIFSLGNVLFEYTILTELSKNTEKILTKNVKERLKFIRLKEKDTWKSAKDKLRTSKVSEHEIKDINEIFLSNVIDEKFDNALTFKQFFNFLNEFYFRTGNFPISSSIDRIQFSDESFKILKTILPIIDNNIIDIKRVLTQNDVNPNEFTKENSFYVVLKNRKPILIENLQKLSSIKELSQGTLEAIYIGHLLSLMDSISGTIYLDEQMAYMHTYLSNLLTVKIITKLKANTQLFITTHNENILDLKLPISTFVFFKRQDDNIKVVHPEKRPYGNIKNIKQYVQNDYFNTYPNIDNLWEMFENEE